MKYHYRLILRITIAITLALNYNILYKIFTPLTIYPTYLFLKIINNPTLTNNIITINSQNLIFTPACIAVSAYLLITLLTILTRKLKLKTILKILATGYFLILAANLVRINTLILLLNIIDKNLFQLIHLTIWRTISTIYVAFIWVLLTKIYKIKTIPVYSDINFLVKNIKNN